MSTQSGSGLSELELASGLVLGAHPWPSRLPGAGPPRTPAEALEAAVLPALRRPPCLVSFSGGRDSSTVLAVATRAARRNGLPDPIPATNRFPAAPASDESAWQEAVVAHLGLREWLRLEFGDELDVVGPIARSVMRRHGLLWPFNAHFHEPPLREARGGSLLTGIGGDELFGAACERRPRGREGLRPRVLARSALEAAPGVLRRPVVSRRTEVPIPWLRPAGLALAKRAYVAHRAALPYRLHRRLAWARRMRYLQLGVEAVGRIADDAGALIVHPFMDAGVWRAMGAAAAPRGFSGRADALRRLFGDLLPPELPGRGDKSTFDAVFWGPHARALAAAYDGEGAPAELVDAEALAAHWAGPSPMPISFTLAQAAWLTGERSAGDRAEQPLAGLGERVPAPRP